MRRTVSLAGARCPRGEVRLLLPVEEPEAAFAGVPDGAELLAAATPASAA